MTSSQQKRVIFVAALILIAVIVLVPTVMKSLKKEAPESWPADPIKLGLDLKGGIYLVLGVQTPEAVKSRLASMASAIKAELRSEKVGIVRAKQIGASGIEFTLLNDRRLNVLEKHLTDEYPELTKSGVEAGRGKRKRVRYEIRPERAAEIENTAVEQAIETIRNRVDGYGVAEPVIQRSRENRVVVQLPDITDIDTVKRTIGSVAKLEFRIVSEDANDPDVSTIKLREGGELQVGEALMTGDAIDKAFVDVNPATNEAEVSLHFNRTGGNTFETITGQNVGKRLAIVLDGVAQSAPVIRERIGGGRASISGGFTPQEAHLLAIVLRAGALPAPLTFLEERTVGSTLGTDSINKGVKSLLLGALLVVIFTIIYYKKAGILAVCSLFLNLTFLLSLLSLLGATLTLPGLAGLVLTVGMAVDANVIIFERIREEIRGGSTANAAVEGGFMKAHWTILDANITTLITALVLYGFGSGPIKGFAVTLSLGIVTSVFCALFVAKVGFEVLKLRNMKGELSI